ncbi:MAG: MFS transporter [Sphaerochaetaceae bacterium]
MNKTREALYQGRVINVTSFVAQFTIAMVNLALVYRMRHHFNLTAQLVGVSASIYTFTYLVACIVLEPLTKRLKPYNSVIIAMLMMACAVTTILATSQVAVAFTALVIYGAAMAFLWPQIESWLARGKEGQALNKATSHFNVAWSLGLALSPLLTGALVELNTTLPLSLAIILFLAVTLLLLIAKRVIFDEDDAISEHKRILNSTSQDESTPLRFISWAGVLTVYTALAVTLTIFPLYAQDLNLFSETLVGSLLALRGLVTVLMFIVLGKTEGWHFKKSLILLTQVAVAALLFLGVLATSYFHYLIFFFLYGILFACAYSMSIFHGASGSLYRAKRMMIHEVLLTIGTVLGSIFGGGIYQKYGFSKVLIAGALLVMIPPIVSLVMVKK